MQTLPLHNSLAQVKMMTMKKEIRKDMKKIKEK